MNYQGGKGQPCADSSVRGAGTNGSRNREDSWLPPGAEASTVGATDGTAAEGETGTGIVACIPAYNEEVSIGTCVVLASAYADEVVVVDDGSDDRTASVAREAGATVLEHEENAGKGAAIRTLMKDLRTRDFEVAVFLDGDGQHIPADIPTVARPVLADQADLVIGSRYLGNEADETPQYRRLGQRVLDAIVATATWKPLTDTQSGFRALSSEAVRAMTTMSTGFCIETEMIDVASREGLTVTERPIDVRYHDVDGQTEHPLRHGIKVLSFAYKLFRKRRPAAAIGVLGLLVLLSGMCYRRAERNREHPPEQRQQLPDRRRQRRRPRGAVRRPLLGLSRFI